MSAAARQVPAAGALVVDHIAHFVPDLAAASAVLEAMGFALTPRSEQRNRQADGTLVPAGAANRCAMLGEGYLEFLTPVEGAGAPPTPIAAELRAAIARRAGIHLLAFGSAAIDSDRQRLAAGGFAPLAPVALQRTVATPDGETTARFTVLRVPAGAMAEGRVQFVHHHTPEAIWQPRWLGHANGAVGLTGVVVAADAPAQAARRYALFTGLAVEGEVFPTIRTARGVVVFAPADHPAGTGLWRPGTVAASIIACRELATFAACGERAGCAVRGIGGGATLTLPPAVGGTMIAIEAVASIDTIFSAP